HKSEIRFVLVEGADDVVPIRPRVRPQLVLVVAMRFAEVDDIQPMTSPTFSVARRSQEPVEQQIDRLLPIWSRKSYKFVSVLWHGRQTGKVISDAANERYWIGCRRRTQTRLFQTGTDEVVNWIALGGELRTGSRDRRALHGLERPPIRFVGGQ